MEAPTVNAIQNKKKDFKYDGHNYVLNLSYNTNLTIRINNLDENKIYENEFSLKQLTEINRYFLMCETIKDIYEELSNLLDNNFNINYLDNNLILNIVTPSLKYKEAKLILNLRKNSVEEEVNFLRQLLDAHEKTIKEQNMIIEKQESKISLLKEKISNLENRITSIESIINSSNNISEIVTNDERVGKLKQLIGRKCNLRLLYQMIKDGRSCSTFHEKVDNQGPTITLFETEDGYKFGGYTSQSFEQKSNWIKDSDSFVFNYINLKKFPIKNINSEAIFLGDKTYYGPEFYDILSNEGDIRLGQIRIGNYIYKQEDLKGGDNNFKNNDVLVYKVVFI